MSKKNDGKIRDIDIRLAFIKKNIKFFEQENITFCNEYGINSTNIVDFAGFDFANNIFYGFEIKSEQDNTYRLLGQLKSYITFFNFVYVIVHEKLLDEVQQILQDNPQFARVGLIKVDSDLNFTELIRARKYIQVYHMFIGNLDLGELRILAAQHNIQLSGSKGDLLGRLRRYVPIQEVFNGIKNKIRKYRNWKCPCCGSRIYYNEHNKHICYKCCYKCSYSC